MNLAHASTPAANDNARKLTRAERLAAFARILRVGVAAGRRAMSEALEVRAALPKPPRDHQGGYSVDVRPGALRLSPADVAELSRALSVRADLAPGELRLYLGGEGTPACAAARACAEVLRDLGLSCAVGSWGLD
jgi:hypothetical protein